MLGTLDHVGYLALDLGEAVNALSTALGLPVVTHFSRPQFSLRGVYLGSDTRSIEVFTFTDFGLLTRRLAGSAIMLEHVAYAVDDIEAVAGRLRRSGVRFAGPDMRIELDQPVVLDNVRHLWTIPETCCGQVIQLLQR